MPSIAPLVTEYRAYAAGYLAVGAAGVALDAGVRGEAGRSLATFAVMSVIMLAVLGATNLRWLVAAVRDAPAAAGDVPVEPARAILRRIALELVFVAALVALGLAGKSGVAALIAGMAFGTGLVNVGGWLWLTGTEAARRITLYRDTPPRLVAMGRRPIRLRDR